MELSKSHFNNIKALKSAILQSRYRAAALVNKELLTLYFAVEKFVSRKIEEEKWGAKVIENLSSDLQLELPGLRGFSASNIKQMRLLYESWKQHSVISPTVSGQLEKTFFGLSFSHHLEIIQNTETLEERIFYIQKKPQNFGA